MNKNRTFTITYYFAFLLTFILGVYSYEIINSFNMYTPAAPMVYLAILNLFLVVIFTTRLYLNNKSLNGNNAFPFGYVVFETIIFAISVMYNKILIYEGIQVGYFYSVILVAYTLLNLYAILSFDAKETKKVEKKKKIKKN